MFTSDHMVCFCETEAEATELIHQYVAVNLRATVGEGGGHKHTQTSGKDKNDLDWQEPTGPPIKGSKPQAQDT